MRPRALAPKEAGGFSVSLSGVLTRCLSAAGAGLNTDGRFKRVHRAILVTSVVTAGVRLKVQGARGVVIGASGIALLPTKGHKRDGAENAEVLSRASREVTSFQIIIGARVTQMAYASAR